MVTGTVAKENTILQLADRCLCGEEAGLRRLRNALDLPFPPECETKGEVPVRPILDVIMDLLVDCLRIQEETSSLLEQSVFPKIK